MKIDQVRLNCRTSGEVTNAQQLYTLYVFRSAVIISTEGSDRRYPACYAVIYTSEQKAKLR